MDTLYELVCHYMKVPLTTPNFLTYLICACPQPQPHLTQPYALFYMVKLTNGQKPVREAGFNRAIFGTKVKGIYLYTAEGTSLIFETLESGECFH